MGLLPIVLHTDADVAGAFCHKRAVGRMKHLDVRHCWLQEELQSGNCSVKRADRKYNASDMLTHRPSAEELRKFLNAAKDVAAGDACSKGDCISCEHGGNVETVTGGSESVRC